MFINVVKNNFNLIKFNHTRQVGFCATSPKLKPQTNEDIFQRQEEVFPSGDEVIKRRNFLIKNFGDNSLNLKVAMLDRRKYEKVLILAKKGVYIDKAYELAHFGDKDFKKALELLKQNAPVDYTFTFLLKNNSSFEELDELLQKGLSPEHALDFILRSGKKHKEEVNKYLSQGVLYTNAVSIVLDKRTRHIYEILKNEGHSTLAAGVLANSEKTFEWDYEDMQNVSELIDILGENSNDLSELKDIVNYYIGLYQEGGIPLADIVEYAKQIDFKKLRGSHTALSQYSSRQLLDFIALHCANDTQEFTRENLTLELDLTAYLKENQTDSLSLDKIFSAFPYTNREIGEIPSTWLKKADDKEYAKKEIYTIIQRFQTHKDMDKLAQDLTRTLKFKTKVKKLGSGGYGTAYKINIGKLPPVCLKIFYSQRSTFENCYHGANVEPQVGLFLNEHSRDYVKMYFGKVANSKRRDGFIVTQFLSNKITPEKPERIELTDKIIEYHDTHKGNYINGMIIDYGGVRFKP